MFQRRKKRVCVISLDGVPGAFLWEAFRGGRLAPLRSVWQAGEAAALTSTLPPISSVAWATYATGVGPGRHGVFGFVDRDPKRCPSTSSPPGTWPPPGCGIGWGSWESERRW